MGYKRLGVFIFGVAIMLAGSAHAQSSIGIPCTIVPALAPALIQRNTGESDIFVGGVSTKQGNWDLNLQHNPDTGSATVFLTLPNGLTCAIFSGVGAMIEYRKPETPS